MLRGQGNELFQQTKTFSIKLENTVRVDRQNAKKEEILKTNVDSNWETNQNY